MSARDSSEFAFRVAGLNFHSTSYDWLVCGGPKCQFKGHGTVNGVGGYSLLRTAIDGQLPGGGGAGQAPDEDLGYAHRTGRVRQPGGRQRLRGPPTTVIGGGSIVIHKR